MLDVNYDQGAETLHVSLVGDIDIYAAPELKEKLSDLIEKYKCDMVIQCEKLDYIDSTGLGVLVAALKKAKDVGKSIRIVRLKPYIHKLFTITGLDEIFSTEVEAQ